MMETRENKLSPQDTHNAHLEKLVAPPDWNNPKPQERYNLVVIGGGTGGLVTAGGAAALGARVALVERRLLGGDCLNFGCVPSKAIIRSARAAAAAKKLSQFGVSTGAIAVDFSKAFERMRQLRSEIALHDAAENLKRQGIDLFLGEASFTGRHSIQVNGTPLQFKKAVIATGARPAVPPIPGLKEAGFLTNETLFSLTERPDRFGIVGGGPIGSEMAQTFARLGSEVTLIEMGEHILPREDRDTAQLLSQQLEKDGVHLCTKTSLTKVDKNEKGISLFLDRQGTPQSLEVDALLISVGRIPNLEELELEKAGVAHNRFGVEVNEYLQTTNSSIYAAGDICMRYKFTHAADAAARIAIQNALFFGRKKLSALSIPWCTYTDPEVAHIGLSEKEAKEQGIPIRVLTKELKEIDRAILDGETHGFCKLIADKKGRLLGATLVAAHAGEMLGELVLAVQQKLSVSSLSQVIHPYPTQAEVIRKTAAEHYRELFKPWVAKLLKGYFRILR